MTQVLRAPLVAAAAAAIAVAFVSRIAPICGFVLALGLSMACAWLALASIDRARRLCWSAAALFASLAGVAAVVGPIPGFDLRHAGPLDALRDALAEPLRRLIPEPEGGIVRGIVLGERIGRASCRERV